MDTFSEFGPISGRFPGKSHPDKHSAQPQYPADSSQAGSDAIMCAQPSEELRTGKSTKVADGIDKSDTGRHGRAGKYCGKRVQNFSRRIIPLCLCG